MNNNSRLLDMVTAIREIIKKSPNSYSKVGKSSSLIYSYELIRLANKKISTDFIEVDTSNESVESDVLFYLVDRVCRSVSQFDEDEMEESSLYLELGKFFRTQSEFGLEITKIFELALTKSGRLAQSKLPDLLIATNLLTENIFVIYELRILGRLMSSIIKDLGPNAYLVFDMDTSYDTHVKLGEFFLENFSLTEEMVRRAIHAV